MNKRCFKCGEEKPRSEFYSHPAMGDGLLGKCKECCKADVRSNRRNKRQKYRDYEHKRFQQPQRKQSVQQAQKRRRSSHPEKTRAYNMVHRAIAAGQLVKQPCEVCGDPDVQAHHEDYLQPTNVRWLCFRHHREIGHGQKVG